MGFPPVRGISEPTQAAGAAWKVNLPHALAGSKAHACRENQGQSVDGMAIRPQEETPPVSR